MKIQFISMRKYKMRLPLSYRLKRLFTLEKVWSGKIWQFRFMCTYGFDLDFRKGSFIDLMLTDKEKKRFWLGMNLRKRRN